MKIKEILNKFNMSMQWEGDHPDDIDWGGRTYDKTIMMTPERKDLLKHIMKWYWDFAQSKNLITKSDYEFIYNIWNNGLSLYDKKVQKRLNKIRNIYVKDIKK